MQAKKKSWRNRCCNRTRINTCIDNIGSRFDESGKLKNWWSEKDYEEFQKEAKM
ncbi:hypothetical protein [Clostridium neonatale]|uniref:Peptidase M13 C-terminal domain-containing protein n=1 Tax=Clostridium neonatale TaxID=137838 RepID=A0AA86JD39_9CLOT|nr:hypothetical protein CNEO_40939 [Clostridium neonatale]